MEVIQSRLTLGHGNVIGGGWYEYDDVYDDGVNDVNRDNRDYENDAKYDTGGDYAHFNYDEIK